MNFPLHEEHAKYRRYFFIGIGIVAVLIIGLVVNAIQPRTVAVEMTPPPVAKPLVTRSNAPVESAGDFAARVHYDNGSSREWGTLCRLGPDRYASVHHVTVNGTPVVGPTLAVTAFSEASDWSFLGVDPATIDLSGIPELRQGDPVTIAGFPARDRDGEILPGRVYVPDTVPPFLWVELLPLEDGGPPEGVVGGISGSCVLNAARQVVGLVHANGFSKVAGTTNTWALIVPLHGAVREALGEVDFNGATSLFAGDRAGLPQIETGRYGLLGGGE